MAKDTPFNLFVYGTLMNASVFRAVLGLRMVTSPDDADGRETVLSRDAILARYKKISPDSTYQYAVPDEMGRIRGYVIGPLPAACLQALRQYEGRNYCRRSVRVQTATGSEKAIAFLGNLKELEHAFGYAFHDDFKQEVLLQQKIEAALLETEQEQLHTTEEASRRAVGELHGDTIRDLVRRHFEAGGISDYAIRHSLKDTPLRDFSRLVGDPQAAAVVPHYLGLVVRQVIFNQTEDRIHRDFRYEFDHMAPGESFYERSMSCLAALRMLNARGALLDTLVADCLAEVPFATRHLVDFVRWAILAADRVYTADAASREVQFIRSHMARGFLPAGAELEFSNIGHGVIRDPTGQTLRDVQYDGFYYFNDFGLDVLTWKLGGHVDDHHEKVSARPRRGFFEVALGSVSLEANLSKPVSDDPWLLNQIIHQARMFFPIAPHSVHISLQVRARRHRGPQTRYTAFGGPRPNENRLVPLGVMKCLFALAGDPVRTAEGTVHIQRLVTDEIIARGQRPHMLFSQISLRRGSETDVAPVSAVSPHGGARYVQQFKFLRLSPEINYEPVALALMGVQLELSPGTFMTASQYETHRRHRKLYHDLLDWGASPTAISQQELETFLGCVYEGLAGARAIRAARHEAYLAWALSELRDTIGAFNALLSPTS
ncbi:MAG: gamma-glutamylcyclotransferase [Phycisphaerae bacterium]|nr:gamma-glutamylcyclotransferase [Phycisphaerae bacterium]